MRESAVERKLVKGLRDIGCEALKFVSPGHSGVPDRIIFTPWGQIYFAELKQKSGALSPAQGAWIHRHREHFKTKVWVLYGPEDVEEFLRYVSREAARYEV